MFLYRYPFVTSVLGERKKAYIHLVLSLFLFFSFFFSFLSHQSTISFFFFSPFSISLFFSFPIREICCFSFFFFYFWILLPWDSISSFFEFLEVRSSLKKSYAIIFFDTWSQCDISSKLLKSLLIILCIQTC